MTAYAEINARGEVLQQLGFVDPPEFMGPDDPVPFENSPDCTYEKLAANINWQAPANSHILKWVNGGPVWVDTRETAAAATQAIERIDALADSARLLAIVNDTREIEYREAAAQARPYAQAGYIDPAPEMVDAWAWAKRHRNGGVPWTGQQAADDILAVADLWAGALAQIRRLRLDAKEEVRALSETLGTPADIDLVEARYDDAMRTLMSQLA